MTPKEKADELVKKHIDLLKKTDICLSDKCENTRMCQNNWYLCEGWLYYAKQCSLIVVNEIEEALTNYGRGDSYELQNMDSEFRYLWKVKEEIEK